MIQTKKRRKKKGATPRERRGGGKRRRLRKEGSQREPSPPEQRKSRPMPERPGKISLPSGESIGLPTFRKGDTLSTLKGGGTWEVDSDSERRTLLGMEHFLRLSPRPSR